MGDIKVGPFDIDPATALGLLGLPNPDGRSNAAVVKPWANGADVTGRPRGWQIIDFGLDMSEEEAALYEAPFELARQRVRPFRMTVRQQCCRDRWWIHHNRRPEMSGALAPLSRCIVTPATAKHRLFAWFAADGVPDHALIVFARTTTTRSECSTRGSTKHGHWRPGRSWRRDALHATTTFETFPFPRTTDDQRELSAPLHVNWSASATAGSNPPGMAAEELAARTLTKPVQPAPIVARQRARGPRPRRVRRVWVARGPSWR